MDVKAVFPPLGNSNYGKGHFQLGESGMASAMVESLLDGMRRRTREVKKVPVVPRKETTAVPAHPKKPVVVVLPSRAPMGSHRGRDKLRFEIGVCP
jgi:hypothetical protein